MSGNLWMFSDKLDDEDIEIMKHEFITYYQGADYYGLGLKMFTRLAHEAGAVYKIGNSEYGKCLKDDPVRHFGKRHVRSPHRC